MRPNGKVVRTSGKGRATSSGPPFGARQADRCLGNQLAHHDGVGTLRKNERTSQPPPHAADSTESFPVRQATEIETLPPERLAQPAPSARWSAKPSLPHRNQPCRSPKERLRTKPWPEASRVERNSEGREIATAGSMTTSHASLLRREYYGIARSFHTAPLLPNGKVLVEWRTGSASASKYAETHNPETGVFYPHSPDECGFIRYTLRSC